MKAVLCKEHGPPEKLVIDTVADPKAVAGHVVIDTHVAALNFPDTLQIDGKYQFQPPMPFTPGSEVAGIISAVGDGVSNVRVGDRVMAMNGLGGMAEKVLCPANAVRVLPAKMSMKVGAGFNMIYGTSYYALKQRAALKPGETLLVLAASGGVGLAAVELGKAMGARVIAAASTKEKLEVARQVGADETISYTDGSLKEQVKALTDGRGADVIYDPVGGDLFDDCMRSIAWYGRVLVIGFAAGDIPKLPTNLVLLKSCQVVGVFYGAWTAREPLENAKNFAEILDFHSQGKVDPLIGASYPLEDFAPAMRDLMERRAVGKVVVKVR